MTTVYRVYTNNMGEIETLKTFKIEKNAYKFIREIILKNDFAMLEDDTSSVIDSNIFYEYLKDKTKIQGEKKLWEMTRKLEKKFNSPAVEEKTIKLFKEFYMEHRTKEVKAYTKDFEGNMNDCINIKYCVEKLTTDD